MPSVEHEGAAIAYRVDGPPAAPPLLLANSLGTTSAMWDDQIGALAQRFLVIRYDHRGHGGSTATAGPYTIELLAADALAVLDALGVASASVCGLSLGGAVALWIASHAPARVERLVVCCSAPSFGGPVPWAERAARVRDAGVLSLLDLLIGRWFTPAVDPAGPVRARVEAMLREVDDEGYAGCCEALGALDLTADLAAVRAPTLVLAGAADPVVTPSRAVELAGLIDGASLVVLSRASHLATIEQPAALTDAVLTHLCGPAAERGARVRRAVLGDAHVEVAAAARTEETADFHDLIGRVAWGEIWTRPGLDARTRSCITVAMLVALGRFDELELHLAGAERNGVTRRELTEILLQSAIYCGFPAANRAFAAARRVFGADDG